MSQPPPYDPYGQQGPMDYYSPPPEDKAPKLIRLAVIFNYISAGLDAAASLMTLGLGLLVMIVPDMAPRNPGDPPAQVLGAIYVAIGCLMAGIATVKFIAMSKLRRASPQAWGWSLAAGIIGCAQVFFISCCCLQVAAGIYTVVILCLSNVKAHLAMIQRQDQSTGA